MTIVDLKAIETEPHFEKDIHCEKAEMRTYHSLMCNLSIEVCSTIESFIESLLELILLVKSTI